MFTGAFLKTIYRIKRFLRSAIRSLFNNEVPEWLVEIYSLLDYVNFINLTPSIAAILTVPNHFFGRVYLLVDRRRAGVKEDLFKSPIKLVTTVATLIWTTKWIVPYVPVPRQKEIFILALVGLPVWIPLVCIVLRGVAELGYIFIFRGLQAHIWGLIPSLKANAFLYFEQSLRYLMVPLSPHTYSALDPKRMFWNCLYFFGYVISVPLLSVTLFFLGARLLFRMTIQGMPILDYYSSLHVPAQLGGPVIINIVAGLTFLFGRLIVYPYSVALLYSLKRPTRLSRRIEMFRYSKAMELLSQRVITPGKALRFARTPEHIAPLRAAIRAEIVSFRRSWREFDHHALRMRFRFRLSEEALLVEKADLLASYEGLDVLYAHLVVRPLSEEQIDYVARLVALSAASAKPINPA